MARKLNNPIPNPPRSISDSSSDGDGALIYTPAPSSPTYLLDPSRPGEVIQGLQNVKLAKDKVDESEQESIKDVPTKRKTDRRSGTGTPADVTVDNLTDGIQILAIVDRESDNVKQDQINAKSAKNRKEKERKKRRKARMAEEDAKKKTDSTIANDKSIYRILKDAGYSGTKQFMDSYDLRLLDPQVIALAKEMFKLMGEAARGNSSEKQAEQPHMPKKEKLRTVEKVEDSSAKLTTAKSKKKNVVGLWEDYFGNETQLANWQRLCVDVGMEEVPTSITQCRKALGKVWVNIFDFLDAKAEGKPVKRYESEKKLAEYTMKSGKIFPKKQAKQGGPARVLLAHIFRH